MSLIEFPQGIRMHLQDEKYSKEITFLSVFIELEMHYIMKEYFSILNRFIFVCVCHSYICNL